MRQILYVHGKGGHGRAVTAAALDLDYEVIQTDRNEDTAPPMDHSCIFAIGDNRTRMRHDRPGMVSVIHPSAFVSQGAIVRRGSYVGPGARIISGSDIGRGTIINTGAIIEHDNRIGEWCHIAPGATLCGTVVLGEGCFIGSNATIRQGVRIAPWTTIGCGGVVLCDIDEPGTYVGVPARKIKSRRP